METFRHFNLKKKSISLNINVEGLCMSIVRQRKLVFMIALCHCIDAICTFEFGPLDFRRFQAINSRKSNSAKVHAGVKAGVICPS